MRFTPYLDVEVPLQSIADCGKQLDYHEKSRLRVGIIIRYNTASTNHQPTCAALSNPASGCKITALAVLDPPPMADEDHLKDPESDMRKWMRENNLLRTHHFMSLSQSVAVYGGEEGADLLIQRDDVDAVFLVVPDEIHRSYAIAALQANKHVLLNDPVSISLEAFNEQLDYARKHRKFVQSTTAFAQQYRVRQFMECVLREEDFGRVTGINAHLTVCVKDLPLVGVNQPPLPVGVNQGCIRRLGRYCVLFSIVLFGRTGSHPISAQVHRTKVEEREGKEQQQQYDEANSKPEPIHAECTVKYSDDRELTFTVGYTDASSTRQRLEVTAGSSMATMSDFVFPHPDGLATYRVYEDVPQETSSGEVAVMNGEAIDIAGGPKHDVVMWKKFAELSRTIDEVGWENYSPLMERVRELSEITWYTKTMLNALMKSYEEGFIEVPLEKYPHDA